MIEDGAISQAVQSVGLIAIGIAHERNPPWVPSRVTLYFMMSSMSPRHRVRDREVTFQWALPGQYSGNLAMVLIGQTQRGHACVGGEMSAMPNTDDNCGDLWPVKDIWHRNVSDTYIVPIRDGAKRGTILEEIEPPMS